jgi:hypothetical protein
MTSPAPSIKSELNHAVAKGIRRGGPGAVELVLIGMAKLVVAACALGILLATAALAGYDLTTLHFAGVTAIVAAVGWLRRA